MPIKIQFFGGGDGSPGRIWKRAAHACYLRYSWLASTANHRSNTSIWMINRDASAIKSADWRDNTCDIQRLD
jgi:hypothetical protein